MRNFSFTRENKEIFDVLSNEQIGILIKKLLNYNDGKEVKVKDPLINLFYNQIMRSQKSFFDIFKEEYLYNKDLNRTHSAKKYNVTRRTIIRWINEIEKQTK